MKLYFVAAIVAGVFSLPGGVIAQDCSKAPDARAKTRCEQNAKIEGACKGKAGVEKKACVAAETKKQRSAY